MPRKVASMTEEVVRMRQEQADDDTEETYLPSAAIRTQTEVESKFVVHDMKRHSNAITDFTEQLSIDRTGRQRGQGKEDPRRPRRVDESNER